MCSQVPYVDMFTSIRDPRTRDRLLLDKVGAGSGSKQDPDLDPCTDSDMDPDPYLYPDPCSHCAVSGVTVSVLSHCVVSGVTVSVLSHCSVRCDCGSVQYQV